MAVLTLWQRIRITPAKRREWYLTLAQLIKDGKPLIMILRSSHTEFVRTRDPLAPVVAELMDRIAGAGTRDPSVPAGHTGLGADLLGLVPMTEAMLIGAGDATGDLESGFRRAAAYIAAIEQVQGAMLKPMLQPAAMLLILLVLLVFYSLNLLPAFSDVSPRARWPGYSRAYAAIADMAIPTAIFSVCFVVFGGIGFVQLSRRWFSPLREKLDRSIWPFTAVARLNGAAMLNAISGFVASGVPIQKAVLQLQATASPYMKRVYGVVLQGLDVGRTAHDCLCDLSVIERSYHWQVKLYGDSTDFEGSMRTIAEKLIDIAIARTKVVAGVIEQSLKILVIVFIVWTSLTIFGVVQSVRKTNIGFIEPANQTATLQGENHVA